MYCTKEERDNYQNVPAVGMFADCAWGGIVVVKIDDGNGVVFWCFEYDGKRHAVKKSRLLEDCTGRPCSSRTKTSRLMKLPSAS